MPTWNWSLTRLGITIVLVLGVLSLHHSAEVSAAPAAGWPVRGHWLRLPVIPDPNWLPGHRGLDIASEVGTLVRSPAAGTVFWVGEVNYVPAITIRSTGGLKHTLQPVQSNLKVGEAVSRGEVIGTVSTGSHCRISCVHWSVREGRSYLDPRWLLPPSIYRLPIHARG